MDTIQSHGSTRQNHASGNSRPYRGVSRTNQAGQEGGHLSLVVLPGPAALVGFTFTRSGCHSATTLKLNFFFSCFSTQSNMSTSLQHSTISVTFTVIISSPDKTNISCHQKSNRIA